ncbi:MAG: AmmeMemoRadiSam system protein B [Vicinamibacterales bacterium]|nr:AmmeMemoRadiSam system protein B [Vicinamibacterales bacterium]
MRSQPIRRATRAGTWYPGSPSALAAEIDGYCRDVPRSLPGEVLAIVAPHAGLVYSGPVAACAYAPLAGRTYDAVVLVGPSHFVAFEGVAVVPRGAFETPFGPIPIAEDLAAALMDATPLLHERSSAHDREHSLEMHLPFVARVLPGVPIVPLVMGNQSLPTVLGLAEALGRVWPDRRLLLVASSDLSHYHDAGRAARLDAVVTDAIGAFDPEALAGALASCPDHACGGGPIGAVMRAARARGAHDARVLCYQDSGDVSGDKTAVVGYVAAAFGNFGAQGE